MIGTPIAFGLTMIVCFTLFYYYWRIRQLRARLLSVQSAPVLDDFVVEFGIGKNVVETFPTIIASELKCVATEDLQCPICLLEYEHWEVLRQLPFCGHIFHTICVGAWFEKQTTCPVCRMSMSDLTETFSETLAAENVRSRGPPSLTPTMETAPDTPSWILVNRRLPLPVPPVPSVTTERDHICRCSQGSLNENEMIQSKTELDLRGGMDFVQMSAQQSSVPNASDSQVVNIQLEESRSLCSTCKKLTKSVESLPSDHSVFSRAVLPESQYTDVQILISQCTIQTKSENTRSIEHRVPEEEPTSPQATITPQESSAPTLFADQQPTLVGPEVNVSSTTSGSNLISGAVKTLEVFHSVSESPQGSFEFQPFSQQPAN